MITLIVLFILVCGIGSGVVLYLVENNLVVRKALRLEKKDATEVTR